MNPEQHQASPGCSPSEAAMSQLAVEESGVDEPKLGKPELDMLVLDKLEVGLTMASYLEELVSLLLEMRNNYL
nr:hypothetical protein [Tanacetum cinerariifolium]